MKKFLAGSAIATIFTTGGDLIAISNTQINDTINLSVESQEVRSGQGNALDYIYYHSSRMEGSLEDAQFNLDYIKHNVGAKESNEAQVYKSINHKMIAGTNTITLNGHLAGSNIWIYHDEKSYTFAALGNNDTITFENTHTELNDKNVCIKYLAEDNGAHIRNLTINANMIPDVVKIVLEAQLFSSESGAENSSRVGTVQFVIPKAQLSGTQEISLTASGVASTPLSYLALKADDSVADACASATGVYGYITEIMDGTAWYTDVKSLAIEAVDDELTIEVGEAVSTYAITDNGAFIVKPANRLAYGYSTTEDGTATWVNAGNAASAPIGLDGVIANNTIKRVFVKVIDANGNDVAGINTDTAQVTVIPI